MNQSVQFVRGVLWSMTLGMAFLLAGCGSSTGGVPASTSPTVTITDPIENAAGIPLDTTFEIVFDTLMDPTSISEDTVYLVTGNVDDIAARVATTADMVYNEAGKVVGVILTPVEPLIPEQVYSVIATTGLKDLLGNSPVSDVMSTFTVTDIASMVVPVVWPVADTVLSSDAAQTLIATLSSMLGVAGDGLSLLPTDLTALSVTDMSLNDILAAVQALNPAADSVQALLDTPLSVETLLGILGDNLPVGSDALAALEAMIPELPVDLLGQSMSLGDILTLPSVLLPLNLMDTTVQDALALVTTNPLALIESVAQLADAGALVNLVDVGPIIATVTDAGGLELVGGVLSQLPGAGTITSLIPTDLNDLVDTILATADPATVTQTLLDGLGGNLLTDILGGLLGGTDLLNTLTGLLGDSTLATLLTGLLDAVTTDPTATLETLLGQLNLGL